VRRLHTAGLHGEYYESLDKYLRPSMKHLPVERYYSPEEFARLKEEGRSRGFLHVESGPLVRSSYHAHEQTAGPPARSSPPALQPLPDPRPASRP